MREMDKNEGTGKSVILCRYPMPHQDSHVPRSPRWHTHELAMMTTAQLPPTNGPGREKEEANKGIHKESKVPTREIKLVYNNINGQSRNMWDEMYAKNSRADIICLTQRDWKQGNKGKVKVKVYWKRHPAEGKQGEPAEDEPS